MTTASRPRAVLITGHQRTGTSVFRAFLNRLPGYADCGEVCTPLRAKQKDPDSFFTFLALHRTSHLEMQRYTDTECWSILNNYVEYLIELHGQQTVLLDVKYDFLHNFSPISWLFTKRPLLLQFAIRRGLPILHFTRHNLLGIYCSLEYGYATGKWHYLGTETTSDSATIRPDPTGCLSWLIDAQRAVELVRAWLGDETCALELKYEDLYRDDRLTDTYASVLEELLGTRLLTWRDLPFRKSPITYVQTVENRDELNARLRNTPFAWMARELEQLP